MICQRPPDGWKCSRLAGHDGPCAAEAKRSRLWRWRWAALALAVAGGLHLSAALAGVEGASFYVAFVHALAAYAMLRLDRYEDV